MIFVWLRTALLFVLRLFIPPPSLVVIPKRDPNAVCPSCGNRKGRIACVQIDGKMLVRHDCAICGAYWMEPPVLGTPVQSSTTTLVAAPVTPAANERKK